MAGAAVKWLRDKLGVDRRCTRDPRPRHPEVPDDHGVYLVPAFVGLGAPHWRPDARALVTGMTLDSGAAHLARTALEAVAYQTRDLMTAMVADGAAHPEALRVDGGMAANNWLCRFVADITGCPVERPAGVETTALGAAFLAGLAVGCGRTWTRWRRPGRSTAASC